MVLWLWKNSMVIPEKLNTELLENLAIPLVGLCLKEIHVQMHYSQ